MSVTISFSGKKVLVTGAGSGIGRALCKRLHVDGAKVYALSKSPEKLESLREECPGIETICVDLESWDATREALKDLEVVDCLVNNAALATEENFMNTTPDNFDKIINVNVKSVINTSQIVVQKMIDNNQGGSIVNISSLGSRFPVRTATSYALSKASLDMLTKSMAVEFGPKNIRVNGVNPGIIMTPMGKQFYEKEPGISVMNRVLGRTPLGRLCEVDEVLNTVLFLLSDAAPMIHGEQIFLDGAYSHC
ncbi:unnamed protein product [Allacma fusca]|uniref:L-xylulose reductase n=1 Tax=Allacma fusca TaxID=39272 RepID=A0A8J2LK06_9HEXA|nr:unnamed protein product [Allacma fusca]